VIDGLITSGMFIRSATTGRIEHAKRPAVLSDTESRVQRVPRRVSALEHANILRSLGYTVYIDPPIPGHGGPFFMASIAVPRFQLLNALTPHLPDEYGFREPGW
jgi:hypothetical protein